MISGPKNRKKTSEKFLIFLSVEIRPSGNHVMFFSDGQGYKSQKFGASEIGNWRPQREDLDLAASAGRFGFGGLPQRGDGETERRRDGETEPPARAPGN